MRVCPTEAIRVRTSKAKIIEERCIDCGECLKVCRNEAVVAHTDSFPDFSKFRYTFAVVSPVMLSQFNRNISPGRIINGLKEIGFNNAYHMAFACEAGSLVLNEFLKEYEGPYPLISSICPTIIRLIQVRYPELTDNLLPLNIPRELVAREIKTKKAKQLGFNECDIGAIYLTPCPAKMISIKQPAENTKSNLDGAVAISDIYRPLSSAISEVQEPEIDVLEGVSNIGLSWARTGGISSGLKSKNWLAVAGIRNVMEILNDIENGKLRDIEFLECYSCQGGCIGGSLTVENTYVARTKIMNLETEYSGKPFKYKEIALSAYKDGAYNLESRILPRPLAPLDRDISEAIRKMNRKKILISELKGIDCGACGSPGCSTFADDVVRGEADISECIFRKVGNLKTQYGGENAGDYQGI